MGILIRGGRIVDAATDTDKTGDIYLVADVLGHVDLHVAYPGEKDGDLPTIPAFGIEWMLPVEYSNLRFYGVGPEETYADRKHAKLGIWDTNAFRAVSAAAGNRQP